MPTIARAVSTSVARLRHAALPRAVRRSDDRGDVPGWVLVTLMTAGLVIALWTLAGDALADTFQTAVDRVVEHDG